MRHVETKTTYLEMFEPPPLDDPPPRSDLSIEHLVDPDPKRYRFLYLGVGCNHAWNDREDFTDQQLHEMLDDPHLEIHQFRIAGQAAGFCELDRNVLDQVLIMYFGLMPPYIGQGLGKYFLQETLRIAWSYGPRRVWLHTCDLDHEAALPNYLKAGFRVYDCRMLTKAVPDDF